MALKLALTAVFEIVKFDWPQAETTSTAITTAIMSSPGQ
jgi:hypothetical protein